MRSFIYGRYDVLQGVRGYEVFKYDRALSRETIKEIDGLFTSRDPDFKILPVLGDFLVYVPLASGEWIFGRGSVEERGEYYSYIMHGVVLDAAEQAELYHNPFVLAQQLNPLIGDVRELPPAPRRPDPGRGAYHAFLADCVRALASEDGAMLYVAGDIAARLLSRGVLERSERLVFPYDRRMDARMWALVWFLLPEADRRKVTLSSLAPFLTKPAHISGSFDRNDFASNHCVLLDKPERTALGDFLDNLTERGQEHVARSFEIFSAAAHDCGFYWDNKSLMGDEGEGRQAFYLNYLESVIRGMEKPSLLALEHWRKTLVHLDLFKWKAWHLLSIWKRNHKEYDQTFREDLERKIIIDLEQNLNAIITTAGNATETFIRRLEPHLDHVINETGATEKAHMALPLLLNKILVKKHIAQIDDHTVVQALWNTTPDEFEKGLRNRIKYKENWSAALDILFRHPHFVQVDPELCAQIFDLLHQQGSGTRELIERIVDNKFVHAPKQFRIFLETLDNTQGMMSRFLPVLRTKLVRRSNKPELAGGILEMLEICRLLDAPTLQRQVADWINHRQVEFIGPLLADHPALLTFLLETWSDLDLEEDAQLRFCWLVKRHASGIRLRKRVREAVEVMLAQNPAIEFLLEQGAAS